MPNTPLWDTYIDECITSARQILSNYQWHARWCGPAAQAFDNKAQDVFDKTQILVAHVNDLREKVIALEATL